MLPTLLACFLLWVAYLWIDRRRLIRSTFKPAPTYQTDRGSTPKSTKQKRNARSQRFFDAVTGQTRPQPTKPKFLNSTPNSSHTSQVSPPQPTVQPAESKPSKEKSPSPQPLPQSQPPTASRPPSSSVPQHQSAVNFDAISREASRRRQDFARVSPKIQNELYRLTHGDVKMIDRLLQHQRSRNPDRPEQWIWEKVICDLERDRGYR